MVTPTLEQVKKYFENAKEVKCIWNNAIYDISKSEIKNSAYGYVAKKCGLFGNNKYSKFAEIISYKEKTYTLTEKFVKELCKEPNIKEAFVREGIIEEVVEIPLKDILATPNDMELGKLVRKLINY